MRLLDRNGEERALLALSRTDLEGQAGPITRAELRLAASDSGTEIDLWAFEGGYGAIEMTNNQDECARLLLEVQRLDGVDQAAIVIGDPRGRAELSVRGGTTVFESSPG